MVFCRSLAKSYQVLLFIRKCKMRILVLTALVKEPSFGNTVLVELSDLNYRRQSASWING